jgi:acyl carrier protein
MTPEQARAVIERALGEVAPDADLAGLAPDADLRDSLELDSLDFLNFVTGLGAAIGQRIEEDDYPRLATMAGTIEFVAAAGGQPTARST